MTPAQFKRHLSDPELPPYAREVDKDCPLDRWISFAVKVLRDAGIETYESCQGGPGHSYPEPTIRFYGRTEDGLRAVAAAVEYGLPVYGLRRLWRMEGTELTGPTWEIVFRPLDRLKQRQRDAERGNEFGTQTGRARSSAAT